MYDLVFGQGFHRDVHEVAADEILGAGIQRIAEFQLAALLGQFMLDDIGGDAQADGTVACLVMAEMAGAFLNDKLAGHLAVTQH